MSDKTRVQFSLRFDNYAELLTQVKIYCQQNKISLTEFTANALQEKLDQTSNYDKNSDIEKELARFKEELVNTSNRLQNVEQQLMNFTKDKK